VNSLIEERASQLDEMRRIRVITNKDVDFEKWVKASDAGKDVKDVSGRDAGGVESACP